MILVLRGIKVLFVACVVLSCASPEKIIYFQDKGEDNDIAESLDYVPILQSGDLLRITVRSLEMAAAAPFNMTNVSNDSEGISGQSGYLIDEDGMIEFPVLGPLKLAGMTRQEAMNYLKQELAAYLNDPILNMRLANFRITVLGEVNNPGTFNIPSERITLLQAIGLAGDLTINGVRNNIMVIREIHGEKIQSRVDLTSVNVLNSPFYYLSQNDVIYVEPNQSRMNSSEVSPSTGLFISIISLIVTTSLILITRN